MEIHLILSLSLAPHTARCARQKIYYKTAGKQLEVELETKALVISILLPILSAASVVLTHYVIRSDDTEIEATFILQVFPYCYLDTYV
jgi:hypothetical protein